MPSHVDRAFLMRTIKLKKGIFIVYCLERRAFRWGFPGKILSGKARFKTIKIYSQFLFRIYKSALN